MTNRDLHPAVPSRLVWSGFSFGVRLVLSQPDTPAVFLGVWCLVLVWVLVCFGYVVLVLSWFLVWFGMVQLGVVLSQTVTPIPL